MENMLEVNLSMSSLDFLNNVINPARVFAGESALRNTEMVRKIQDELNLTVADFLQATPESGGTPQNYIMLTFDQMMSEFPEGVNAYHVRVIDRLGARLVDDPDMLGKYRRIDDVR